MSKPESKPLMGWYNYNTKNYDYLEEMPSTGAGLMPYVPDNNPAYRSLFQTHIMMGVEPKIAYRKTLEAGIKKATDADPA